MNVPELKNISEPYKDLSSQFLQKKAKKTIKADDALKNEFFNRGIISVIYQGVNLKKIIYI